MDSMKNEIHTAARDAQKNGILDDKVYDADIIEAFASSKYESLTCYLDIPISSLVALRPRDVLIPGSSWRMAALSLDCEGWDEHRDEILDYFISELKEKSFPAPNSYGELRIGFTGGAIYCKLGNHRAAAAKAWLANSYGEEANLKQASCYYRNVKCSLRKLMEKCVEGESTLKIGYHTKEVVNDITKERIDYIILVEHKSASYDLYALDSCSEDLHPVLPSRNCLKRLFKSDFHSKCLRLDFKEIPVELMKLMLNDSLALSWFENKACSNK